MPIRINLLAETQAAEDLRRRDPVKRVIFYGALLVALALVWSSSLQLEVMLANKEVTDRQTEIQARTNEFAHVTSDQKQLSGIKDKLELLRTMTACRFLQGNLLNALQQANVDNVQLTRIQVEQTYSATPGVPAQVSGNRTIPGRPGQVKEKIVATLNARDCSANPGDQVEKFKQVIASEPFFRSSLSKTNGVQLVFLSSPQVGMDGKPFVSFTLECHFQEVIR